MEGEQQKGISKFRQLIENKSIYTSLLGPSTMHVKITIPLVKLSYFEDEKNVET